jgi:DMSO/TMAO reductase YedYZ heme-binding membrane subunit
MNAGRTTFRHYLAGVRFYIAIAIFLLTFEVWWWADTSFAGSSLLTIRLEEVYAWLSVGFLSSALLIGPACKVFKRLPGKAILFDARRLMGIGAAWFATLHISIAYLTLFKLANPFNVPGTYRTSFFVGGLAWLVLLAMAFTSFDAAFHRLGKWWFRIHRFVYAAAVLAMLHAFIIGAHSTRPSGLIALTGISVALVSLHAWSVAKQSKPASYWQLGSVAAMVAVLVVILSFGYNQRNQYRSAASQGVSNVQKY